MDNKTYNFPILGNLSRRFWISLLSSSIIATGNIWASEGNFEVSLQDTGVHAPQQATAIKGWVVDSEGNPVIGANVWQKGTTRGVITDMNGQFTLNLNKGTIICISFIGYKTVEIPAAADMRVVLQEDTQLVDEVVVTGYGTFKKSAFAGSASNLKSSKIADVPAVSFQDMLQGNASGVQFSQSSGQPGSSTSISIRGMGSFNASNTPLYVIDGVPVRSGSINTMDSDAGLDIMSTINTSDIENITIIKDAAAASLYGSRAANGVVLITTKQGREGKAKVSSRQTGASLILPCNIVRL